MKTFVVAYISFMDNELKMEKVKAESDVKACQDYMMKEWNSGDNSDDIRWILELPDMEAIKQQCYDCDSMINAIEV
jgi:hypothetical protein